MIPSDFLPAVTAGDLMTREILTIRDTLPLADAVTEVIHLGCRHMPVVDALGRCVGVLAAEDVARWAAAPKADKIPLPRTCSFQHTDREPDGRETVACLLREGACPFQHPTSGPDGQVLVCNEPHCVATDWQVVETVTAPKVVRDLMSTVVVSVRTDAAVADLAGLMLTHNVHHVLVLDSVGCPIGEVSVNELLQMLAHPEPVPAGG